MSIPHSCWLQENQHALGTSQSLYRLGMAARGQRSACRTRCAAVPVRFCPARVGATCREWAQVVTQRGDEREFSGPADAGKCSRTRCSARVELLPRPRSTRPSCHRPHWLPSGCRLMRCPLDLHVHLRVCLDSFPGRADSERVYVIELHDTYVDARWSIGRVLGSRNNWMALVIGADRWTPLFPTRDALCNALMMIRGEHADSWRFEPRPMLSDEAIALITGCVRPPGEMSQSGVIVSEHVWREVRAAFLASGLWRWTERLPSGRRPAAAAGNSRVEAGHLD